MAFFSGAFLVSYIKDVPAFLSMLLLCNLPFCLIGLAQWAGVQLPSLWVPSNDSVEVSNEGRLSGSSDSPTTFAFYLVNLFAVALCCWLLGTRRRDRFIGAFMTILTALEIIGSGTRGAAAAVAVIVIIALVVNRRFRLLLFTIFSSCIVGIAFTNQILQKFTTHGADSDTNRLFLWNEALKLIMANPWIGIGMEQFPTYYAKLIVSLGDKLNPAGVSVHNQYLDLAMESGIPWLIVVLLLLFSIVVACWSVYRIAQRKYQSILFATILMIVANLVISFVDVPLEKIEASVFLFLLAGLALGNVEMIKKARMDL
jgi:O-antigen ligase